MVVIDHKGQTLSDAWVLPSAEGAVGPHGVLTWEALLAATPDGIAKPSAVLLPPDAPLDRLAPYLPRLDLIVVQFPKFRDGRGFTLARSLREKYAFKGDLRALGHVIPDQMPDLLGCGFSSIITPERHPPEQWREFTTTVDDKSAEFLQRLMGKTLRARVDIA